MKKDALIEIEVNPFNSRNKELIFLDNWITFFVLTFKILFYKGKNWTDGARWRNL